MTARGWWMLVLLGFLLAGCAQQPPKPFKKLVVPAYPGAHIVSVDPLAPDATPGFTYHKTVFETPDAPATVLAWYDNALRAEGWQPEPHSHDPATEATYHYPTRCSQPNTQDVWIVILSAPPGATQVELGVRDVKCRSDR